MKTRLAKINTLIQKEYGKLMLEELEMPRGVLVTITQVKTSPDLHYATIFISILPAGRSLSTLARLKRGVPRIQRILGKRLVMRPIPRLRLALDPGEEHAARIETLLAKEHLFGTKTDKQND